MNRPDHSRYVIKSLVHASQVLNAFQSKGEVLRLRDLVTRTGFSKTMCFRLLYTLHSCGFLEKVGENQYRLTSDLRPNRRYRIGYAGQGQDSSFSKEVEASMLRAAESANVELVVVDNNYDPRIALRSVDHLIRKEIDLAVEFQTDDAVAPAIARKYLEANIPMIAIDIPHPGATYFGANNYEAGLIGGRHLGRWAKKNWNGEVDEVLLVELTRAGSLPRARIRGILAGLKEVLRLSDQCLVSQIDGDGHFGTTLERVRKHLRSSAAKRILVGAANDPVVGQNAEPEARAELRQPRTRLIGSVAYFPEKYGEGLIHLALDILARKPTPPAVFIKHQFVTPENVDHLYPND